MVTSGEVYSRIRVLPSVVFYKYDVYSGFVIFFNCFYIFLLSDDVRLFPHIRIPTS